MCFVATSNAVAYGYGVKEGVKMKINLDHLKALEAKLAEYGKENGGIADHVSSNLNACKDCYATCYGSCKDSCVGTCVGTASRH